MNVNNDKMTNHSSNIKVNFEELPRLYAADESLVRMLQKIQEEIAKTDVEWMHLRSLVDQKSGSSNETDVKPSTTLLEKPQIKVITTYRKQFLLFQCKMSLSENL